jgi:hypothetical protein
MAKKKVVKQKQKQTQKQSVIVNIGTKKASRASSKKPRSAPPSGPVPITYQYLPRTVYYGEAATPSVSMPVGTSAYSSEARRLGAEPRALRFDSGVQTESPLKIATGVQTESPLKQTTGVQTSQVGILPSAVATEYTPQFNKAEYSSSYESGYEPSPDILLGKKIAIPKISSPFEEGPRKFTQANYRATDGIAEYRRRYGENPPNYFREYANRGITYIGLGTFLNKNLPKPPPTIQEYRDWYQSIN